VADDPLWAPWRLGYVLGNMEPAPADARTLDFPPGAEPSCFLCQAMADPDEHARYVVYRGKNVLVVLNIFPYNNGHVLIAPKRHVARLDELDVDSELELAQTITKMVGLLERSLHPEGFNVGLNLGRVAGAGVPGHLHWHVVPRWNGDTNFMPVIGSSKVIPQSLDALWTLLRGQLDGEHKPRPRGGTRASGLTLDGAGA
jgi:ATP adenylyltransferase